MKKIKRIKIDHIDKIEGHAGFIGSLIDGKIKKAKFEVQLGIRLFERIVIGRNYEEVPIITSRVCGVCPVVHYLTALKALETALGVKPSKETVLLRKLMMLGQIIQSHSLHIFFMSLSDFFNIRNSLALTKKFPKYTKLALDIRNYGNKLISTIGGRSIHPVSAKVGGFRKVPSKQTLLTLFEKNSEILKAALDLALFFSKLRYPKFSRKTEFIALKNKDEYAIYEGNIVSTEGLNIPPKKFEKEIEEIQLPYEVVKRVLRKGKTIMPGALARININHRKLNKKAKKVLKSAGLKLPCYNSFYNIFAQAVEIVHCIEEAKNLLGRVIKLDLKNKDVPCKVRAGQGVGSIEAPRGTLYHAYKLDRKGKIVRANIITPTAQFISNLEEDLKEFLPKTIGLTEAAQKKKIKMLIRAYDPCVTCSVH